MVLVVTTMVLVSLEMIVIEMRGGFDEGNGDGDDDASGDD